MSDPAIPPERSPRWPLDDRTWRMNNRKPLFWMVLFGIVLSCSSAGPAEQVEVRILVFSKTAGFRHASIEHGISALEQLADDAGFQLDTTEDGDAFTPANLRRYQAVVFLSTTGDILNEPQQLAMSEWIRAGGGFVGVHSASDTEYDWPWYGQLVGAYFDGHPGGPNVRTGRLIVAMPDHPATASLPGTWVRSDEWYDFRDLQGGLSILLKVDELSYKTPEENPLRDPRPIAWFREFDGGRTFYTGLGHTEESYADPLFLEHVWGGLTWVLGQ